MEINKLTFKELCDKIYKHNEENHITSQFSDKNPLKCRIVFTKESFNGDFDEKGRTYEFTSDNKYFLPSLGGSSIFGNCLDGTDDGVRLDWYLGKDWKIEYCYIVEDK